MNLLASRIGLVLQHTHAFLDQLNLPSRDEYITAATAAFHDVRIATSSSWKLAYLTFRPMFILLGIITHCLVVILQVIAKHSVAHGWVAAKEGYLQLRTATVWFLQFQRGLPPSAKYAEVGVVSLLITLWLLRRHVQKYRYAERTVAWYNKKKQQMLDWYHGVVEKVAKTSLFLALMLPHVLYIIAVVAIKRLFPSVLTYLATRTYLISFISLWRPLYLTFSVIGRLTNNLCSSEQDDSKEAALTTSNKKQTTFTPSQIKQQQKQWEKLEDLREETIDLLKYWVVYAILSAIFVSGKLMPFIGTILNTTGVDDAASTTTLRSWFRLKGAGMLGKLRLTSRFVEEVRLVFFVWLCLMPVSLTGSDTSGNVSKFKSEKMINNHRPIDTLYSKLSPFAISAMNSSAFVAKTISDKTDSSFFSGLVRKLQSLLDLAVMVRLISESTKNAIVTIIVESSALLPAAVTLFMPSYFTSFGVIYVSLVVPAGYSIHSYNAITRTTLNLDNLVLKMEESSRYLQFWVVSAAFSALLGCFAPLLAWIPLSTHATWLVWAYIQMESSTRKVYSLIEKELVVFGLLRSYGEIANSSVDDTIVVRSAKKIIAALPSNVEPKKVEPKEPQSEKPKQA